MFFFFFFLQTADLLRFQIGTVSRVSQRTDPKKWRYAVSGKCGDALCQGSEVRVGRRTYESIN